MKRRVRITLLVVAAIAMIVLPAASAGVARANGGASTVVSWQFPGPAALDSPVAPDVTTPHAPGTEPPYASMPSEVTQAVAPPLLR
jgi:hypothetical protein